MTTTTEAERVVRLEDGPLGGDTQVIIELKSTIEGLSRALIRFSEYRDHLAPNDHRPLL